MAGATPHRPRRSRRGEGPSRQVVPLELIRGRPFLRLDTGLVLLDTSAATSGPPTLLRQQQLCVRCDAVLGMDRLREETILIDRATGRVELGPRLVVGDTVPILWNDVFPCVSVAHRGTSVLAAIDTSEAISLAPATVVRSGRAPDVRWETLGGMETFELETALVRLSLGCRAGEARCAVMPGSERVRRERLGLPEWVVGAQQLLRRRVVLDFAASRLIICGGARPRK